MPRQHPRTVRAPLADGPPGHLRACPMRRNLAPRTPTSGPRVSPSISSTRAPAALSLPPHSLKLHSLSLPKPWRSSTTLSSTIEAPPPRRSLAGASPEIDADELHHLNFIFFLGARSFSKLLPPFPSSSSSFEQGEQARASPSHLPHLEALAGVPPIAGKLIPSPIYSPLP